VGVGLYYVYERPEDTRTRKKLWHIGSCLEISSCDRNSVSLRSSSKSYYLSTGTHEGMNDDGKQGRKDDDDEVGLLLSFFTL
jgi:hypothetical protein